MPWAFVFYLLYKIMMGVIQRRRLLKPNEADNKMESATQKLKRLILYTNKEGVTEPRSNEEQVTIATETMFWSLRQVISMLPVDLQSLSNTPCVC